MKKDTASAKEGKVSLLRRGGQRQGCALRPRLQEGYPSTRIFPLFFFTRRFYKAGRVT